MDIEQTESEGLHLRVDNGADMTGITFLVKAGATAEEKIERARSTLWMCYPLSLELPCGCTKSIPAPEAFPTKDLRCDCGRHWFVRWEESEKGA